jgi:hypothetical protein
VTLDGQSVDARSLLAYVQGALDTTRPVRGGCFTVRAVAVNRRQSIRRGQARKRLKPLPSRLTESTFVFQA